MKQVSKSFSLKIKCIAAVIIVITIGLIAKFAISSNLKAEEPKHFLDVTTMTTKLESDTVVHSGDVSFVLKRL